jgi:hypothetical protein
MRAGGHDPASAIPVVRRAIACAALELPIESIKTATARIQPGTGIVLPRSGFSVRGVGLAGFGPFGVLSYAVVRRTPELGLRMTLGALRSRLLWGVVRERDGLTEPGCSLQHAGAVLVQDGFAPLAWWRCKRWIRCQNTGDGFRFPLSHW